MCWGNELQHPLYVVEKRGWAMRNATRGRMDDQFNSFQRGLMISSRGGGGGMGCAATPSLSSMAPLIGPIFGGAKTAAAEPKKCSSIRDSFLSCSVLRRPETHPNFVQQVPLGG